MVITEDIRAFHHFLGDAREKLVIVRKGIFPKNGTIDDRRRDHQILHLIIQKIENSRSSRVLYCDLMRSKAWAYS